MFMPRGRGGARAVQPCLPGTCTPQWPPKFPKGGRWGSKGSRAGPGQAGGGWGRTPTGSGIVPGAWSRDSKKHRMPSSPPTIVARWWQPLQPGAPGRVGEEWVGQRPGSSPQLQGPSVPGPCRPAPPHTSLVADCSQSMPAMAMPELLFLGNSDSLWFKWHLLQEASPPPMWADATQLTQPLCVPLSDGSESSCTGWGSGPFAASSKDP